MRAEKNISNLLGISQENLAMMLKVTRAQLSMYECGLHPIPTEAMKQLAKMVVLFYEEDPITMAKSLHEEKLADHEKVIQRQLDDNLHEQYSFFKIIEEAETKYNSRANSLSIFQN